MHSSILRCDINVFLIAKPTYMYTLGTCSASEMQTEAMFSLRSTERIAHRRRTEMSETLMHEENGENAIFFSHFELKKKI